MMPRLPRLQLPGAIYHIVTRGDGRRAVFHDDGHDDRFTDGLADDVQQSAWDVTRRGKDVTGGKRRRISTDVPDNPSCDIEQINHAFLVQCFRQTDDRAHGRIAVFAGFNPRDGLTSHAGSLGKLRHRETG